MKKVERVTIYGLAARSDGVPRYVGMTTQHPTYRLAKHLNSAGSKRAGALYDWLRLVVEREDEVVILPLEIVAPLGDWEEAERRHIAAFRSLYPLLNVSDGGRCHNEETRARIAAAHVGLKHSPETLAKIAAAKLGKKTGPHSEEWNAKISASNTGHRPTAATLAKLSASHMGKKNPRTPEWQEKLNAARRGRKTGPLSVEHRAKISAASKLACAARKKSS